jgi:hypothetical protein
MSFDFADTDLTTFQMTRSDFSVDLVQRAFRIRNGLDCGKVIRRVAILGYESLAQVSEIARRVRRSTALRGAHRTRRHMTVHGQERRGRQYAPAVFIQLLLCRVLRHEPLLTLTR